MSLKTRNVSMQEVQEAADLVATDILRFHKSAPVHLFGVPRGGIPAAALVASSLNRRGMSAFLKDHPASVHAIVDDIIDSGKTRERYLQYDVPFFSLFSATGTWLVFPWEETDKGSADDIPLRLLQFIGEDVTRGGLAETPERFLAAWREWTAGYKQDPKQVMKAFEDGAIGYDEIVLIKDIPIYSHCEHHLAPFFGKAHIGYIPNGKIVGLSKLVRLANVFAKRLQVQERLTMQIAEALESALSPRGSAVVLECRHMCMESRGVQSPGTITTTSCLKGAFIEKPAARAEFMRLVR